jgi:hypothetical protein
MRLPMKSGLRWFFEGCGRWTASSWMEANGSAFQWKIRVIVDGSFSVNESDRELTDGKVPTFANLDHAKEWCDEQEDSARSTYQYLVDKSWRKE